MKIILAEYSGHCFGVRRAVEMAENAAELSKETVCSYGEIIHNAQVVENLSKKGVQVLHRIDEMQEGKLIIRSHGVAKKIIEKALQKGIELVDATCPFVRKIQKIVEQKYRQGYHILIVGDKNHPEVIGVNGWCEDEAAIVSNILELSDLKIKEGNYVVVAQTTISEKVFQDIEKEIKKRIPDAEIYNTICTATHQRQQATNDLAKKVDCMVVIGGKNSSNTRKLAEIASASCKTYLIESCRELDIEQIKTYEVIGISAGASTPNFLIQEVINFLKYL